MKRLLLAWYALLHLYGGGATGVRDDHEVLASIDERLRALDAFGYTLKLARLDFSLEQLARRMEGVEAKLARLDAHRDEPSLSRRLEGLSDKVSAKAALLEDKLERVDLKLDLLDRDLHGSVEDLLERMVKSEERWENLNLRRDEMVLEKASQIANRSEGLLKDMQQVVADRLLEGQAKMDAMGNNLTTVLDRALSRHESKSNQLETYTRKVLHGIQDLWKTSDELKAELSQALGEGGRTRDEFRRLVAALPALGEETARQVSELSATVDASFATLLVAQNAFIDSCRRVQQEETHVYGVLQQVVYEMRNRSVDDVRRISTQLRTQGVEFNRSLAQVVTALQVAGNQCSTDAHNKSSDVLLYEDTEAMQDYEDYVSDYPDST